ncbi:hypothetical protein C2G38_2088214 [Gigaspora rosea]|uniref:DUF1279 domain-containing protein n=1 Tax=Gigaspora rosea TaxID=44941 RepID=A0A397V4J3_9GLOM|nr:hypothetical protein C2G38_2088214 [Gigaspora rosea]
MFSFTNVTRPLSGFHLLKFKRLCLSPNLLTFTRGFTSRHEFILSPGNSPFSKNFTFRRDFTSSLRGFIFRSSPGLGFVSRHLYKKVSPNSNSLIYSHKSLNMSTSVNENKQQEHLSMTARLKQLTRQYGASAIAVYFLISTIDLGLTFVLIHSGGAERVKMVEEWIIETFGGSIVLKKKKILQDQHKDNGTRHFPPWAGTFVIAYGIHKILFPLRLGLTAAVTPPLVKKLRKMGWNIGRSNKIK